ncbi:MAG: hypothetical protein ACI304_04680 [Lepagella sp.]
MNKTIEKPDILGLNRIAIVCNSPVNESKKLNSNPPDYKAFATAKSCGFNVVMYPGSEVEQDHQWIEYMDKALTYCSQVGIKLISNSPILCYNPKNKKKTDWPKAFIELYPKTKTPEWELTQEDKKRNITQDALDALVGWQLKDEPYYQDWHKPNYYYEETKTGVTTTILPKEETEDGMSKKLHNDGKIPDQGMDPLVDNHGEVSINDYKLKQMDCEDILENHTIITGVDKERPVFSNLAVDNDPKWIGHNSTYNEFLDEYISKFTPPLLSFDYYPIETLKNDEGKDVEVFQEDTFYQNLLMFANKSKQYNIPFWAYCLCLKHLSGPGGRHYPYPTEGMMRIEAFSALAFGAQGIVYWQYRSDDLNSGTSSSETSQSSPTLNGGTQIGGIDSIGSSTFMGADEKGVPVYGNGITTSVWQSIKNINRDIIKENKKFFNCKFIKHRLCSGDHEYSLNGDAGIDKIKASGKGFLMTYIETPDPEETYADGEQVINEYIVIVSRDPFESQELEWTEYQNMVSHTGLDDLDSDWHDNKDDFEGNSNGSHTDVYPVPQRFTETLPPGGYKIFKC